METRYPMRLRHHVGVLIESDTHDTLIRNGNRIRLSSNFKKIWRFKDSAGAPSQTI